MDYPDVETKLATARTRLILEKPFLGALVLRLPMVVGDPSWCETTFSDGKTFYYNNDYIDALDQEQTQFALSHEALHCALLKLSRVLSNRGQSFLKAAEITLKRPATQEVVESLLDAIANYFIEVRPEVFTADDINAICSESEAVCDEADAELCDVLDAVPELKPELQAMLMLSCLSVKLINPIFSRTDAIGSMMRKKIKPITDPIVEQLHTLMNK